MAQADDIKTKANNSERIPFKMHPRIFAALGADLVTNDSVAIVELVKNSYDAWATAVEVKFDEDIEGAYLEVTDNGIGMSRNTISDVWCVVATPNKHLNQKSVKDGRVRRVSGEKGLGRLSVARLGQRMRMWTQQKNGPCYEVSVDWTSISGEEHIAKEKTAHCPLPTKWATCRQGTRC